MTFTQPFLWSNRCPVNKPMEEMITASVVMTEHDFGSAPKPGALDAVSGYTAWRNTINGSWFMQSLCEMLKKHRNQELMHIMTRVNNKVALEFEAATTNPEVFIKQIPCIVTMLTKDFYFC
ncbi:unnamed protein product [Boreogadus saida]